MQVAPQPAAAHPRSTKWANRYGTRRLDIATLTRRKPKNLPLCASIARAAFWFVSVAPSHAPRFFCPIMVGDRSPFAGSWRASNASASDSVGHRGGKCRPRSPCGLDAGARAFHRKRDRRFALLDFSPRCGAITGRSQNRVGGLCLGGAIVRSRGRPGDAPTDQIPHGTSSPPGNDRDRYDRDYRSRILNSSPRRSYVLSKNAARLYQKIYQAAPNRCQVLIII